MWTPKEKQDRPHRQLPDPPPNLPRRSDFLIKITTTFSLRSNRFNLLKFLFRLRSNLLTKIIGISSHQILFYNNLGRTSYNSTIKIKPLIKPIIPKTKIKSTKINPCRFYFILWLFLPNKLHSPPTIFRYQQSDGQINQNLKEFRTKR